MMLKSFIVEDEAPARERLVKLIQEIPNIEILGWADSGKTAIRQIDSLKPDVLFLDIRLPDISGMDILHLIQHKPHVIFTTAYDQYAVEAFALHAIDYLLKPFSGARLQEAIDRVMERDRLNAPPAQQLEKLFSKWKSGTEYLHRIASRSGDQIFILPDDDVVYFAVENKLVFAFLENGKKYILNYTLEQLESRLDPGKFFRIHRSTIVNLNYVHKIEAWFGGGYKMQVRDQQRTELNISRAAGKALREKLGW